VVAAKLAAQRVPRQLVRGKDELPGELNAGHADTSAFAGALPER